mmetsp:Transcript_2621/g.4961  ORF Transcript_2621/g.4961 Transcript_2621/m.4961 type:complete len:261 (+) Transcript_2621:2425-3207(+)
MSTASPPCEWVSLSTSSARLSLSSGSLLTKPPLLSRSLCKHSSKCCSMKSAGLSLTIGWYIRTGTSLPLTWISSTSSKATLHQALRWRLAALRVARSHSTPAPHSVARCIKRADRLTVSPRTLYSLLPRLPTTPQKARPVVIPMLGRRSCWCKASWMAFPATTALTASSSCASGGRPNTAMRVLPLSSIKNLFNDPSYLYTAFCTSRSTAWMRLIGPGVLSLTSSSSPTPRLTNNTDIILSSLIHLSSPWPAKGTIAVGM